MTGITKTALITGASSGIGIDIAKEFAERGVNLVLLARREQKLQDVKQQIVQFSPNIRVEILVQDLIEENALSQIQTFLDQNKIEIDYLVNNAGFGLRGQFHELDQKMQTDMIRLNVERLTQLCHHFLPSMVEKNRGGILNVASVAGFQPGPKMSVYFATKAFVLFLTEGIVEEVKDTAVLISALCPGPTESEFGQIADMGGTRLFNHGVMKSEVVAKIGVKEFFQGKAIIITGVKNKVLAFANRLTPRFLVRKITHYLQK